jgi:hypothetical protein
VKRTSSDHRYAWLALLAFLLATTPPWPPPPTAPSPATAAVLGLDGAALGSPVGMSFSTGSRGGKRSAVLAAELPGVPAVDPSPPGLLASAGQERGSTTLPGPQVVLRI